MPITITQLRPGPRRIVRQTITGDGSDSDNGGVDIDGDVSMRQAKRLKRGDHAIITPGEVITDDSQWMRGHGTYVNTDSTSMISSVAGTIVRTNKLLSVRPLRARYNPEVGDLVVGRIVEVQAKRWRVDIGSNQLAALPLSAINLPGGIQRRRTETDELQIRTFFAEGDLLVAEVQQLYQEGGAVLHTRSLMYGKLRNGLFASVSGTGGGGGVVRARRQVWTMDLGTITSTGSKIDVILGVNGYIWISKHVESSSPAAASGGSIGITNIEDRVSATVYGSQNTFIEVEVMREITRVRGVITALVEHGLRVDEDMVMRGYQEAVEMARHTSHGEDDIYLGDETGRNLAALLSNSGQ